MLPDRGGLYLIRFQSGAEYIGMSADSMRCRLSSHQWKASRSRGHALHAAMRAHPDWVAMVLVEDSDPEFLALAEQEAIASRRRAGIRLYNLTESGEGAPGWRHSRATRQRMAESARASWTEERKSAASSALKGNLRMREAQIESWSSERRNSHAARMRAACPTRKLSDTEAVTISARLTAGESCASIARSYGITPEAVSAIKTGKNWSHVTGRSSAVQ